MLHYHDLPNRRVALFENERYSPLSGWSAKGLLLTDRKALSNHDGSDGFNSMEDADKCLLSNGDHSQQTHFARCSHSHSLSLAHSAV
jgi:hypothetical protein